MTKTNTPGFDRAQVLAPLVIGVSGHRDLREEDRQGLQDNVEEILLKFRKDYSATPLILVSALAEGADRLAAKVALAPHVGVRLIVPLPMPLDLYELDFHSLSVLETPVGIVAVDRSSREEFRALLEKADDRFELQLAQGNTREAIAEPGPQRDRQYELVGRYIAQQSQILIALWDGVDSNRVGGTASVVRFQKEGVPDQDPCALEAPEGFPVYHVLTPRVKNPFPQGKVLHLHPIYPKVFQGNDTRAENYYANMFARLNEFNKYVLDAGRDLAEEVAKSRSYLFKDMRQEDLPVEMRSALNRYAVADALAIRFQRHLFAAQKLIHGLTFAVFFCFLLFVHHKPHLLRFLLSSAILFVMVGFLHKLFKKWAGDTKHEDYRAMAEGLRVRFFWKLVGIKDSVADHYLGKQRSELDWIRNGFRGWNVLEGRPNQADPGSLDPEDQKNRLGFVRKYWINDQQQYFQRASEGNLETHESLEYYENLSIGGVIIMGFVLLGLTLINNETYFDPATIALEAFLAGAAILHHYDNQMAYNERAKQYQRMASLFAHASDLLGKFLERDDYENAVRCVKKIGNEALTENGDWVLLRRGRPLEVPHP
ncbi:MAG: hypothetical protein ABSH13_08565 [Candidatus Acidiferrum sp.]